MKYVAHRYFQHEQEYLSLVMPFNDINSVSEVLIYGDNKFGYQRKLDKKHYMGIKNTLINDNEILPTSIILSVNKDDITDLISTCSDNSDLVNLHLPQERIFRVVDGQHRLKGLEEASKEKEELFHYMLNVIILITEEDKRVLEVEVFRDINAKAKRLKTDLTLLAEHNYRLLGQKEIKDNTELINHMSIKAAYYLNEYDEVNSNTWRNGIKFDIHIPSSPGIIGVSAFTNSIKQFVRHYIQKNMDIEHTKIAEEDLIGFADEHSKQVAIFLNDSWEVIRKKWPSCFEKQIITDDFNNLVKIYYDKGYYIQKTTGVNALHDILWDCMRDSGYTDDSLEKFKSRINKSTIKENDWSIGGAFSGLTSKSGFKKAKNLILSGLEE